MTTIPATINKCNSLDRIKYLERVLFPENKFPKQSFDRIKNGRTEMTVSQLTRFGMLLGVSVSSLMQEDYEPKNVGLVFEMVDCVVIVNIEESKITIISLSTKASVCLDSDTLDVADIHKLIVEAKRANKL